MDGHRLIFTRLNGEIKLFTRHANDVTLRYPELQNCPISSDCILDGELVCINGGKEDFELLMKRFHTTSQYRIKRYTSVLPVCFYVFDILYYDGNDLRALPLFQRKQILNQVLMDNQFFKKVAYVEGNGEEIYQYVIENDLEGVVCKDRDSRYVSKRSAKWLKIINWKHASVVITGYRKKEFGWLVKETNGHGSGVVEFGPSPVEKTAFKIISRQLVTHENDDFIFIEPVIKAKIKYRMCTSNGYFRIPVFEGFII
jgi:DNA ligase-1